MKQYVISDIHGCLQTFHELLYKIGLNRDDELYLLGDYIDRGPNSSGVLDLIMKLKDENYKIFPLRGNHEEHILKAIEEYDLTTFIHFVKRINKSDNLLNEDGSLITKYRDFFQSLPYYYLLDEFILVHAGLNASIPNPFEDKTSILDLRYFNEIEEHPMIGDRRIIHGHVPTYTEMIQQKVAEKAKIIPLDNGCVYTKTHRIYDYTKLGTLMCLELNSFELTSQMNID